MIGRPWKPDASPAERPYRTANRRREMREPAAAPPLGFRLQWIVVIVTLILIGATATALFAWRQIEERQRLVAEERERFAAYLGEREQAFGQMSALTAREQQLMRRSLNAQHVQAAQLLGISPITTREQVSERVRRHDLVRLDGSTDFWVSRMSYSVPYVTPDGAAALDSIAARFHERLAEKGLPPFQFNVTSVLRTREDQALLRRVNVNAARGASSHEFGTTFDVHYRRFRYAEDPLSEIREALGPLPYPFLYDEFARELGALYQRMAERYVTSIGAELGRALIDLENSGYLLTIREARQPVYHVTVARRLAPG